MVAEAAAELQKAAGSGLAAVAYAGAGHDRRWWPWLQLHTLVSSDL